jgi:hypothetical protein
MFPWYLAYFYLIPDNPLIIYGFVVFTCWVWFIVLTLARLIFLDAADANVRSWGSWCRSRNRLDRRVGSALDDLYFFVIVKKPVKLINELIVIHCAGLCLQFSLAHVYVSRRIGARRLSFFRAGSRGVTLPLVALLSGAKTLGWDTQ